MQNKIDTFDEASVCKARLFERANVVENRSSVRVSVDGPDRDSGETEMSDETRRGSDLGQSHVFKRTFVAADRQAPDNLQLKIRNISMLLFLN